MTSDGTAAVVVARANSTTQDDVPSRVAIVNFVASLESFGDNLAVVADGTSISYKQLGHRIRGASQTLGDQRRLILSVASNTIDSLVWYLAALATNNPIMLVPAGNEDSRDGLLETYDPDVVVGGAESFVERRTHSAHALHPELALLLSTSGSTGSPKLVRLSHENLSSNATAIAEYLHIRPSDRAITTLPMGYCYGLSVINSHLSVGAAIVLTELSVVDPCFWRVFADQGVTSLSAVPYTFDLLDRVGFEQMTLPTLRYVTQAGGRLPAERVRNFAELGRRSGWDFVVMYGQTEATARMAFLPSDLALAAPESIGGPIPGGDFRLAPMEAAVAPNVGELVYRGANVMLGYANSAADLAVGRTVHELHTGDIARRRDDGLYEIVGRRGRFAKVFGKRIDLDAIEMHLANSGVKACALASLNGVDISNETISVVVEGGALTRSATVDMVAVFADLPRSSIVVVTVAALPRNQAGKPDSAAMEMLIASERTAVQSAEISACAGATVDKLQAIYADCLGQPEVSATDSFVSLGGDSMSYIEVSLRLEDCLGNLPADWHLRSIQDLVDAETPTRSPVRRLIARHTNQIETNVFLRALAILIVVGSHITLFDIRGGAHLLIAIAGYNFARFHLTHQDLSARMRRMGSSVARIAIPSALWMAVAAAISSEYSFANAVFLHNVVAPGPESATWRYWFVEALVYVLVAAIAIVTVPTFARWERRWPFGFALGLVAVGLVFRFGIIGDIHAPKSIYTPWMVLFLFALGWAIARADSWPKRLLVLGLIVATVPGYSDTTSRVVVIIGGMALLTLFSTFRLPRTFALFVGYIASASLFIYLTHWQIYPIFGDGNWISLVAALTCGLAFWWSYSRLTVWGTATMRKRRALARRLPGRLNWGNSQSSSEGENHPVDWLAIEASRSSTRRCPVGYPTSSKDPLHNQHCGETEEQHRGTNSHGLFRKSLSDYRAKPDREGIRSDHAKC